MGQANDMGRNYHSKVILALSIPQIILLIAVSCAGLFVPGSYPKETLNWQAQSMAQDAVDLFLLTPLLVVTALLAAKNNRIAWLLWSGLNLYLIYTFVIYCFDINFNKLFIAYCLTLGLSFYSFVYFLYSEIKIPAHVFARKTITRFIAVYFLVIAIVFYCLWLSEIIPAVGDDDTPKTVKESGLTTNPVQVIDLAIFLPGLFIVAALVFKNRILGFIFIPAMLVFMILMDITIAVLMVVMKFNGFGGDYTLIMVMTALALLSLGLLIAYLKTGDFVMDKPEPM